MPIAAMPDPIPDFSGFQFHVQFAGIEGNTGPACDFNWNPFYSGTGEDIPAIEAVAQAVLDGLASIPGITVQSWKNRTVSQEITPT